MVATVLIEELNTVGQTATDKTSGTVRYKTADNSTVDNNDIPVIPGSGSVFSFEKWLRLNVTVAPDTQIENLRAYTSGVKPTPSWDNVFGWYRVVGTFATPTQPANTAGLTDLFTATSGSPADLDGVNTGPFTGTGQIGDYFVTTLEVQSTATQGALVGVVWTASYDES